MSRVGVNKGMKRLNSFLLNYYPLLSSLATTRNVLQSTNFRKDAKTLWLSWKNWKKIRLSCIIESFHSVLCSSSYKAAKKFRDLSEFSNSFQNVCSPCQFIYKWLNFFVKREDLATNFEAVVFFLDMWIAVQSFNSQFPYPYFCSLIRDWSTYACKQRLVWAEFTIQFWEREACLADIKREDVIKANLALI